MQLHHVQAVILTLIKFFVLFSVYHEDVYQSRDYQHLYN
jgi:hypothetical protein